MDQLTNKRVLLGVSGGIAAYKSALLVRELRRRGAQVRVMLSDGGAEFVGELTFQALSGQPVHRALLDPAAEAGMGHIELARWPDLILIAPASANTLAKLASGLADSLLSATVLASAAPLWVAPAMNRQMWAAAATVANLATLRRRGVRVLGPDSGEQACGDLGAGRLLEPQAIVEALAAPYEGPSLAGVRAVVSAGPTREAIDPVRYLSNHSSGKMGYALARALSAAGAAVQLVSGPTALAAPAGVERVDVDSALQMREAVLTAVEGAQLFVATAAVADYRPAAVAGQKIKKSGASMTLQLLPNPDILAEVSALERRPLCVGFAAETEHVERHARAKLEAKRLDAICANSVAGEHGAFGSEENELTVYFRGGQQRELARAPKHLLACRLVALLAERLFAGGTP